MASKAFLQQAYLAYFGRPADTSGLATYASATEPQVKAAFSASPESQAFFGGLELVAKINAIYQNLFNRDAEPAGLLHWMGKIGSGEVSLADAAMTILANAQNSDKTAVANKLAASDAFVASLDTTAEILGYAGAAAIAPARAYLKTVDATAASLTAAVAGVNAAVATVVAAGSAVAGQTFTLTAGVDAIVGTSGNDTINGQIDALTGSLSPSTLTGLDAINGGAGNDTLNLSVVNGGTAAGSALAALPVVSVSNVETANIRAAVAVTASTSTWAGLTALNVTAEGDADLTAASTTNVVSTVSTVAANGLTVAGGNNVTVNASGVAAGTIEVGGTAGAPVPAAGNVVVNAGGTAGGSTIGTITVRGGDNVTVNQTGSNLVNTTATLGAVIVDGDAGTLSVTVNNPARATATLAVAGVSLGGTATVTDAADATGKLADTINTVSLTNYGNSTVASSALTTVNLTGGATAGLAAGTLGLSSQSVVSAATALTINSAGGFVGAVSTTGNAFYKSIDINSSAKTTIADLTTNAATTTLNFTGSADTTLTANTLSATLVDINVTGTGGVTLGGTALGVGVDFDGGDGKDTITIGATTKSITMGAGNDLVIATAAMGASGSVDGGAGFDIVGTTGHTAGDGTWINAIAATGFEAIGLATPAAGTASAVYNMTNVTLKTIATTNAVTLNGATGPSAAGGTGAGANDGGAGGTGGVSGGAARIVIDKLAPTSSLILSHSMSVVGGAGAASFSASVGNGGAGGVGGVLLDLAPLTNTGADAVTLTLEGVTLSAAGGVGGAGSTAGTGGDGGAGGKAIKATNFETINIISNASADGLTTANTITANGGLGGVGGATGPTGDGATGANGASIEMTAGGTINISGAADLNLGHVGGAGATDGFNVNASALTGKLTVTVGGTSSTAPSTITGGSGNDTLTGSGAVDAINGGAGNDVIKGLAGNDLINGGAGNDTITGGDGTDIITLGEGSDTVVYAASASELVTYVGADTNAAKIEKITDFNVADDTIQLTADTTFAGISLLTTTGITVNEGAAAPFQLAAGLADITALTAMMETVASGVASTNGAATAATGLQAYVFQTAAGNGAFDGKTFLVINNGTAALAAGDVIIELTGMVGTLTAADFTFVTPVV